MDKHLSYYFLVSLQGNKNVVFLHPQDEQLLNLTKW